jgi:hypothetical protein
VQWSPDGSGFFAGDMRPGGARLLHVNGDATPQVLLTEAAEEVIEGIPSPDGKHLATYMTKTNENVWMVDNR